MTILYRGKCPNCGHTLLARPKVNAARDLLWKQADAMWKQVDALFATFERLTMRMTRLKWPRP